MSPLARSLLALAAAASLLLQGACAIHQRRFGANEDASVSLGLITGSDIVYLPQIQIGVPDVIVTIPNDCDPYGYLRKDLLGSEVIISNRDGGAPPIIVPVDPNDPQSDLEVHCQVESEEDNDDTRCPGGLDVKIYQFCREIIQ